MNKFKNIILGLALIFSFSACEDANKDKLDLSGDVSILSFKVNGIEADIDQESRSISLLLPPGTNLASLTPVIELPEGATCEPPSNTQMDFSNSSRDAITYQVFNNDFYETYKVKIEEIKASITLFKVDKYVGEIDEANRNIKLFIPEGTNVSNVIPSISYTEGAVITPKEGEALDLNTTTQFTLEYAATKFVYTLEVIFGDSPGLVIFNGEDVSPTWASLAAKVESPYANPQTNGINPTPFCASVIKSGEDTDDGGKPWSGGALWANNKVDINPAEYSHFTLLVLKEVQGDVQLEIQSDGEENKDWLKAYYSEDHLGEWQLLTFQIPADRTAVINNILVGIHAHDAGQPVSFETHRAYWDELIAHPK